MAWQFVIGPASGGHQLALTEAKSRQLVARLTSPSEASFTINGRRSQAGAIAELATDLHVLYSPPDGPTLILYRGRIAPTSDDLDDKSHTVQVSSLDYRDLLNRRLLYAASTLSWTATDQAEIAWQLLQQTQTLPGGNLGISKGIGNPSGVVRDRAYAAGDSIGQRIQELSELVDGFDWDLTPASPSALSLDLWASRGADRGVVLEYGGLVTAVKREVRPSDYANAIRVTGDQASGGTPPTPQERTATDIATRAEGRWDNALTAPGITDTTALSQRADWLLADAQVVQPSYTLTLRRGAWQGPGHIWLGDTVRVVIKSGRLAVTGVPLRVQEIDIQIPEEGIETVQVTVGRPRVNYNRRPAEIFRRLRDVERR